jgi:translation initiation factor 5
MININGNISDANYRYKMEKISLNNCGSGNGQYTIINNMDNIAESINTPSEILYKYFAFVLGSSFNEKKKSLTGTYSITNMEEHLYDYINKFVMCPNCNIPELMYKIENKNVCASCSACGKNNNIKYNTRIHIKVLDLIEKYLIKNKVWVKTKGLLVEQKESKPVLENLQINHETTLLNSNNESKIKSNHEESTDDFNPF